MTLARRRLVGATLAALGAGGLLLAVLAGVATGGRNPGAFLLLALAPGLLLAAGLALLRGPPPAGEREPPAPVPVPASRIPEGPVKACMRCGSPEMIPAPLGADALFSQWACATCGARGVPLRFDSGEEWAAFVRALHEGGRN